MSCLMIMYCLPYNTMIFSPILDIRCQGVMVECQHCTHHCPCPSWYQYHNSHHHCPHASCLLAPSCSKPSCGALLVMYSFQCPSTVYSVWAVHPSEYSGSFMPSFYGTFLGIAGLPSRWRSSSAHPYITPCNTCLRLKSSIKATHVGNAKSKQGYLTEQNLALSCLVVHASFLYFLSSIQ